MIAFGGAAPLHAGRLCEKLAIDRLLVPPGAGVGSAIGFLRAPFSFEANRSVYMRLSDFRPDLIRTLLQELQAEATGFVRSCDARADIIAEFKVYMRYSGQGWEIPVSLDAEHALNPSPEIFKQRFEEDYKILFGRVVDGMDIEITVWAVNATTPPQVVSKVLAAEPDQPAHLPTATRSLFDPARGDVVTASVVQRHELAPGDRLSGPAAIIEDETTIIVPSSRQALCQTDGCIDVLLTANRS